MLGRVSEMAFRSFRVRLSLAIAIFVISLFILVFPGSKLTPWVRFASILPLLVYSFLLILPSSLVLPRIGWKLMDLLLLLGSIAALLTVGSIEIALTILIVWGLILLENNLAKSM